MCKPARNKNEDRACRNGITARSVFVFRKERLIYFEPERERQFVAFVAVKKVLKGKWQIFIVCGTGFVRKTTCNFLKNAIKCKHLSHKRVNL